MGAVKVGTCNYCGTRAALVLSGETRHELACSNCGAPLHDLKLMPKQPTHERKSHRAIPASSHQRAMSKRDKPGKSGKKYKKKKSKAAGLWGEIWDIVEDIID